MRRYIPEIGKSVNFPDGTTEEEIRRQVDEYLGRNKKDDGIDALDALKSGWSSGWGEAKDSAADYMDLVGLDDQADSIRGNISRAQQGQFVPEGLVEKLLAGLGSAPGAAVGMAPAVLAGIGVTAATANPILGTAAGFGLHGAVRGGDGDLLSMGALKEGAIGAVEGAAFGGLGKLGRLGTGAAMAGIGAGGGAARSVAEGGDINAKDVATQAATMGLLGLAFGKSGKRPTLPEAETKVMKAISGNKREALLKQAAEEYGIPGWKPAQGFPINTDAFTAKQGMQLVDMFERGQIKMPKVVGHVELEQMANKLVDMGDHALARKLVVSNGEKFADAYGGGKLAAENLSSLKVFKQSLDDNRELYMKREAAVAANDSAAVAALDQQISELSNEVMAISGYYQGYRTESARTMNMINARMEGCLFQSRPFCAFRNRGNLTGIRSTRSCLLRPTMRSVPSPRRHGNRRLATRLTRCG